MIERKLEFELPKPWQDETFSIDRFGPICILVGPNGSGKSRFAEALKAQLGNTRMLGTDRLSYLGPTPNIIGDHFGQGYQKGQFGSLKKAGTNQGSGLDTFVVLEERPDIRLVIEATLSNLFSRTIKLEWDSGNLVPRVLLSKTGDSYRADREECHGIRELLVLLTHLHNDQHQYLIIDEPELNLHPQYQSFFMQEVRKIAGEPVSGTKRKGVFLITHSPFIIDLRSPTDLASVIAFSPEHTTPTFIELKQANKIGSMIPRLNVHHKQLFFSDNPIFVEGILDASLVEAIQERRNVSVTAAGSCIIDVGGCEEVTKYLELCEQFKKKAYFFYDLDSLFFGNLRRCINADGSVKEFLAQLGLGDDFGKYVGELERTLTDAIEVVSGSDSTDPEVAELRDFIATLAIDGKLEGKKLARARVALLTDIAQRRGKIIVVVGESVVSNIEGRLQRIVDALKTKNVLLLPGGAIEHYLPCYKGGRYALSETAKRTAVDEEILLLASGSVDATMEARYGQLYNNIEALPAKAAVDVEPILKAYASDYVHELQSLVMSGSQWGREQLNRHFERSSSGLGKIFQIAKFESEVTPHHFKAEILVTGPKPGLLRVTHKTNAGMQEFEIEGLQGG